MKKFKLYMKSIYNQKRSSFIFFTVLLILGVLFGSLFVTVLDKSDKELVNSQLIAFFSSFKQNDNRDIFTTFFNSLFANITSVFCIWLLGVSVIGIPLIIILFFCKGFVFGFSIGSIISVYNIKGIVISLIYMFPHQFINIIILFVLSLVSFNLSVSFFKNLLLKRTMDFKVWTGKYYKLLFACILIMFLSSVFETFLFPYLIKLITPLI